MSLSPKIPRAKGNSTVLLLPNSNRLTPPGGEGPGREKEAGEGEAEEEEGA